MIQTADGQQFTFGATGGGVRKIRLDFENDIIVEKPYEELGITYEEAIDALYNKNDILLLLILKITEEIDESDTLSYFVDLTYGEHMTIDVSNPTIFELMDLPEEFNDCLHVSTYFGSNAIVGVSETSFKLYVRFAG